MVVHPHVEPFAHPSALPTTNPNPLQLLLLDDNGVWRMSAVPLAFCFFADLVGTPCLLFTQWEDGGSSVDSMGWCPIRAFGGDTGCNLYCTCLAACLWDAGACMHDFTPDWPVRCKDLITLGDRCRPPQATQHNHPFTEQLHAGDP
uniref:Uncharacterized protein n=1 Tax=Eutreptiella gymnastica TaxID=73025 RepID=A0A7S4FWE1_9EUGL|mmetsp:Transcript_9720/g.16376  ORF Transcript_9720/g.16376 Transcript_9720/m.16376 type:complete len:146 (+) Transcript_9720:486-923(+)